ncbi:MAG: isocitrate lyase/phosphoenolpyruvate mutase family protein [Spirochaetota bacterium]|nr:isocitrate lyase/phosphoenolpyruvate mutase family protein [Spirochaetota bacterium]
MSKATILRDLFKRDGFFKIVGAHNGLTARLVELAGFEGIWASSLEVSASHAVPDANILTMIDYLNAAIDMNEAVSIPIVVDVDQGYGNSTNVIHMVKKFEAAGIAGIVMEDKLFPKQNSLLADGRQELASIAEFVGKVMAAKNAQISKDFMVIARTEALIAGWGQEEAMKRARAYVDAGADGIMIHSKKDTPDEILEFVNAWDCDVPLVIVPTNYHSFTEDKIKNYPKIKMVIYANHVIRSAVTAIKETLREIKKTGGIDTVSPKLIPISELFELQGTTDMKENEKRFLMSGKEKINVIIPAAGAPLDPKLREVILKDTPVCMLDVNGKSILQRNVEILNSLGISSINVVVGYNSNKINIEGINKIMNTNFEETGVLDSIMCAEEQMDGKTLIIYSDILFEKRILEGLIKKDDDIVLVIDSSYKERKIDESKLLDLVIAKDDPAKGERILKLEEDNEIIKIGQDIPKDKANFEFVGIALFSKKGIGILKKFCNETKNLNKGFKKSDLGDFNRIIQKIIDEGNKVSCFEVHKGWTEVHTFEDYKMVSSIHSSRD